MHRGLMNMRGNGFGGRVSAPAEPMPAVEYDEPNPTSLRTTPPPSPPERLSDLVPVRLAMVNPESEDLKTERARLLGEAGEACARWDAFLDACADEKKLALERRHQEIREAGRILQTQIQQLTVEFWSANSDWNDARATKDRSINAVKNLKEERLSRWATDAEINGAKVRLVNAKLKASEAVNAEAATIVARNHAEDVMLTAKAELSRLAIEEVRIKAQLEGRAIIDPEYGLPVPA